VFGQERATHAQGDPGGGGGGGEPAPLVAMTAVLAAHRAGVARRRGRSSTGPWPRSDKRLKVRCVSGWARSEPGSETSRRRGLGRSGTETGGAILGSSRAAVKRQGQGRCDGRRVVTPTQAARAAALCDAPGRESSRPDRDDVPDDTFWPYSSACEPRTRCTTPLHEEFGPIGRLMRFDDIMAVDTGPPSVLR